MPMLMLGAQKLYKPLNKKLRSFTPHLLVINVDMAGSDLLLELCGVLVPQLGGFTVQRRRTTQ